MKTELGKKLGQALLKNKYAALLVAVGLLLLLLPTGGEKTEQTEAEPAGEVFSLAAEESRLATALGEIRGAGQVRVLLSVRGTAQRQIARDSQGEVVLASAGGDKDAVELNWLYPDYQGAVVVCQGADAPAVRLAVTEAVAAFTGLGTDRIQVIKMQS